MTTATDTMSSWQALVAADAPDWRARAAARFAELGLPHHKNEEWRLTKLRSILEFTPTHVASPGSPDSVFAKHDVYRINLGATAEVALPAGVTVESQDSVQAEFNSLIGETDLPFAHLNTAICPQVLVLRIARGVVVDRPLLLLHAADGDAGAVNAPRVLVIAEELSQATVIEHFVSADKEPRLTTAATEFIVSQGAIVDHYRIQDEALSALHVGTTCVSVARDATFSSHAATLGGGWVRNDVQALFTGENAECTLNGLYLGTGSQVIDNHTLLDHTTPHCNSYQIYKGILDDRSEGVFNGKIFVHPGAQKTDAKQTNRALLLSDNARVNTKPQLEIFADDVKCTHGATIGQLDEEAVYYLRSRGIPDATARAMLTHAFAGEALADVQYEPFAEEVERLVHMKFKWSEDV